MLNIVEDNRFLIDLNLAIKLNYQNTSSTPSKTSTKVFIAISTLYGEYHSFMHDLESFFQVLFQAYIYYTGLGGQRRISKFQAWNFEIIENLAKIKTSLVLEEDRFYKEIEENITVYCILLIPYIEELRKVVFPKGKRWLEENHQLYSRIKLIL